MTRQDRVKYWLEHDNPMNIFERAEWDAGVREICLAWFRLQEFTPTADKINALPEPLRCYIHDLETVCDPSGTIAQIAQLTDQNKQLIALNVEAEEALRALENAISKHKGRANP